MQRRAHDDPRGARRWYRRQVRRSIGPILWRRLTEAWRHRPTSAGLGIGLGQDLRLAIRALSASPAFAVSTVLILGFGVGAFTVVYAVVDAQVVRPLPFGDHNDRLVTVHAFHPTLTDPGDLDDAEMSYPDLIDVRAGARTLEAVEGVLSRTVAVSTGDETRRVRAASVTPGLFSMLGVAPAMGRTFTLGDGAEPGFEAALIVSHELWRDLLAADPLAVGGTLRLNDRAVTVVGVMAPGFAFPEEHDLWLPYDAGAGVSRQSRSWLAIGLLRPGVQAGESVAELQGIAARLAATYPDSNRDWTFEVHPIRDYFVSVADEGTMLAAICLLLLVACANVAGLIVARGIGRRRELDVRTALGARRARLIRFMATEAVVLTGAGGLLGLALAAWGIRALVAWMPEPPPYWAVPALDARVIAVALTTTALVALAAGVVPAVRLSRVRPADALSTGARAAGHASHRRLRHALVVGQVGLSFALVTGALLLGRSATVLLEADAGFDHRSLLSARVYLAGDRYDPIEARVGAIDDMVGRIAALPGVAAAAATGAIPSDDGGSDMRLVAPDTAALAFEDIGAQLVPVTPSFWSALDLSLVEGRTFSASESTDPVADAVVVNRRLAERFWPGESAVGRILRVRDAGGVLPLRVVGVAPDLVYEEFGEVTPQSELNVYVPYARVGWRTQALLIRAAGGADPASIAASLRSAIRGVDTGVAVYDVKTMIDRRQYNHWGNQFIARTMTVFAIAALILACVGAYGISAQSVAERRREIGIRMAIGATTRDIRRLFLGTGARLAGAGAVVGVPLALLTARAIEGMLFRVSPWDGRMWAVLPAALATAVLFASYWPARRASRTDPSVTLRDP